MVTLTEQHVCLCVQVHFSQGRTPLMYACVKGQEKIVRMLIECGADPEVLDQVCMVYCNFCLLQMI